MPPLPQAPWAGARLDWPAVASLAPTAAAIALLGAIETLLCAVVGDGMAGSRHDPDAELIGLGIGNMVAPFFGGFAATGAIARTATGIRAGSRTPIAVVIHSLFLLAAMLALAPLLGFIPMAAMAGLLLKVAWDMSEAEHVVRMVRIAPHSDVTVLVVCLVLTVVFDMVVAVAVGIVLAALLFMRRMVEISGATLVGDGRSATGLPPGVVFYDVAGPLFFGGMAGPPGGRPPLWDATRNGSSTASGTTSAQRGHSGPSTFSAPRAWRKVARYIRRGNKAFAGCWRNRF